MKPEKLILKLNEVGLGDIAAVGEKNAHLGEMIKNLSHLGIKIPGGFVLTALVYKEFIKFNSLEEDLQSIKDNSGSLNLDDLKIKGAAIRNKIINGDFPDQLKNQIEESYKIISLLNRKENADVAIRSSVISSQNQQPSFDGEPESFLNICGIESLFIYIKKCFASLVSDRALSFRPQSDLGISICIQKMVRSDFGASGTASSLDTKTGFEDVVVINGYYGLGKVATQALVSSDEFITYKPLLKKGYSAILEKKLGEKERKRVYAEDLTELIKITPTTQDEYNSFCLNDSQIVELSKSIVIIEEYFSFLNGELCPIDIEWALDGLTQELYIVQAKPENFHCKRDKETIISYKISELEKGEALLKGIAIGEKIGAGEVKIIDALTKDFSKIDFKKGDILVAEMTNPDWEPIMQLASAIITEKGSRTCHTAILARELGVPAVVGCENATHILKEKDLVTVSCAEGEIGMIFKELLSIEKNITNLKELPKTVTPVMINIASPDRAFQLASMKHNGIGLARMEFIINNYIKIHPLALLNEIDNEEVKDKINHATKGYKDGEEFFIEKLSNGLAKIAASCYPKQVIVRFSDFKSNEYANLLGGKYFEPEEENPLIGWRGASRYYSSNYKDAFGLECKAIKNVRENLGLNNITVMIPFCRTVGELKKVYEVMEENGLKRRQNGLQVYLMAELPSNFILAEEFAEHVDGFSIGSNDLTQLVLGLDRDSSEVAHLYDERNAAVKKMILMLLDSVQNSQVKIGICGQGPSDFPDFAQFLVDAGIDTISVTPDSFVSTVNAIAEIENKQKKRVFKMSHYNSFI